MRKLLAQIRLEWLVFCLFLFRLMTSTTWAKFVFDVRSLKLIVMKEIFGPWDKPGSCQAPAGPHSQLGWWLFSVLCSCLLRTDSQAKLLPAKWKTFIRICTCCKLVFKWVCVSVRVIPVKCFPLWGGRFSYVKQNICHFSGWNLPRFKVGHVLHPSEVPRTAWKFRQ